MDNLMYCVLSYFRDMSLGNTSRRDIAESKGKFIGVLKIYRLAFPAKKYRTPVSPETHP